MNKLWSIINYSANLILALIIILMPYFEVRVISSTLLLVIMISFTTQLFKDEKSQKFLIISNLFLTACFLGVYTFFEREALLHIGGAFYILWLIFAFVLDLTIDWREVPIEKWFNKKENKTKKKEKKTILKTPINIETKEEDLDKKIDEDFDNYDLDPKVEPEIEEDDDFEIQEVRGKIELPYKLFTKKGTTTLHRESCRTLKKTKISDLVEIHSMEEAQAYDLKPCKVCKPGE